MRFSVSLLDYCFVFYQKQRVRRPKSSFYRKLISWSKLALTEMFWACLATGSGRNLSCWSRNMFHTGISFNGLERNDRLEIKKIVKVYCQYSDSSQALKRDQKKNGIGITREKSFPNLSFVLSMFSNSSQIQNNFYSTISNSLSRTVLTALEAEFILA